MDPRSLANLKGVHPDLIEVLTVASRNIAITKSDISFIVTEGCRTMERQQKLLKSKATRTLNSRHIPDNNACKLSCAVDLAVTIDGAIHWDWPLYDRLAVIIKEAANVAGIPIEWGGDWKTFRDGPHFQLPKSKYP